MAITQRALASAMLLNDTYAVLDSATGTAAGNLMCIDGEYMTQVGAASGVTVQLRRGGQLGSAQKAHNILAVVETGLPGDFPAPTGAIVAPGPGQRQPVVSYGVSGAIAPPTSDTVVFLNKATAAAMTLVSPTAGTPDGTEVLIYSNTAAAHTCTYTPGFNGNTTTSDVATFAATIGNSMTIIAANGVWGIKALAGVTLG